MGLFDTWQLWCVLRMVIAGICGGIIGLERTNRAKEAGVRTHFVVACASALMMIVSKYGFADLTVSEAMRGVGADGARLAAQVVSGIGFLGAGMIFVHKNTVTGLTTAAGIWATAGVGLAVGAGMYTVGIAAAVMIIAAQLLLHKNFKWLKHSKSKKLAVYNVAEDKYQELVTKQLAECEIAITNVDIERKTEGYSYVFSLDIPLNVSEEEIAANISYPCKIMSNM